MNQKKLLKPLTIAASLGLPAALWAAPYRNQVDVEYTTGDIETENFDINDDNFNLRYTFYLTEVDDSGILALSEAPFLNMASSVHASLGVGDFDSSNAFLIDEDAWSVGGRFVSRQTGWLLDANYWNVRKDLESPGELSLYRPEFDAYGVSVGKYIGESSTLSGVFTLIDYDNSDYGSGFQSLDKAATAGLAYRFYGRIGENMAHSFDASYHFVDQNASNLGDDLDEGEELLEGPFDNDGQIWTVGYNFYPAPPWKLGVSYADTDELSGQPFMMRNVEQVDGLAFVAEWYATERLSLAAIFNRSDYEVEDDFPFEAPGNVDEDYFTLRAGYRF